MRQSLYPLFILFLFLSCEKQVDIVPTPDEKSDTQIQYKTYTIKKGHHSSASSFRKFDSDALKFKAIFDESAIYEAASAINQHDIHKLYGFSDCGTSHHKNSARFGWRWYNDSLEIHAYTYAFGKRQTPEFITTVSINEPHNYLIQISGDKYIFSVDEKTVEVPRGCSGSPSGYYLNPYFGGDETAPHDVNIKVSEEN